MASRSARALVVCLTTAVVLVVGGCLAGGHAIGAPPQQTATIPVGQSSQALEFSGLTRTFHLYRPEGLSGAAPLVVMLHGGYGDGAQAERSYNWDAEADSGHFLVAYPDGVDRAWNAGTCCGRPQRAGIDDVGFLTTMVASIQQQTSIDADRVYVTGMSNGRRLCPYGRLLSRR
jgi:polyhydroxybutyrate depolymerase